MSNIKKNTWFKPEINSCLISNSKTIKMSYVFFLPIILYKVSTHDLLYIFKHTSNTNKTKKTKLESFLLILNIVYLANDPIRPAQSSKNSIMLWCCDFGSFDVGVIGLGDGVVGLGVVDAGLLSSPLIFVSSLKKKTLIINLF